MVRDHEAVNKQALDLVKKLNVTPEDNDTSKTLSKQAADKLAELAKLKGADYDKAYVANEVAYHKAVNGALETLLIPSATNAELKSLLQTGLKIFQGHQQHAEQVAAEPEVRRPPMLSGTAICLLAVLLFGTDRRPGACGDDPDHDRQSGVRAGRGLRQGRRHHRMGQQGRVRPHRDARER